MLLSLSATLTIVSILLSGFIFCRSEENIHPLLIPGKCKRHVWRTDPIASLPGICFFGNDIKDTPGLIRYGIDINTLKDIKIKTYKECRTLCCNLGDKCNTWQYQNSTGTCKIDKGFVRRGPEGADTAGFNLFYFKSMYITVSNIMIPDVSYMIYVWLLWWLVIDSLLWSIPTRGKAN